MRTKHTISLLVVRILLHVSLLALSGLILSCAAPRTREVPREDLPTETRDRAHGTSAAIDIDKAISHFDSPNVRLTGQTTEILRSPTGSFVNLLGEFGFGKQYQYSVEVVDFEIRPVKDGRSLVWVNRPEAGFRRVERGSGPFGEAARESISNLGKNGHDLFRPGRNEMAGFLIVSGAVSFVSDDDLKPVSFSANEALYEAERKAGLLFDVWRLLNDPRTRISFARFVNENPMVERKSWNGQPSRCVSGWSSFVDQGGVYRVYCFSEKLQQLLGTEEFVYADEELVHYRRQSLRYIKE